MNPPSLPGSSTSNGTSFTYSGSGSYLEGSGKAKKRSQSLIQKSPVHFPGIIGNREVMRGLTGLLQPVKTAASYIEPSPLDSLRIRRQQVRSYVRMRPLSTTTSKSGVTTELSELAKGSEWIRVNSSSVLQVTPPPAAATTLSGQPRLPSRDIQFQFRHVLTEDVTQSEVFRMVSGPAIDQLFHSGCGLILCTGAASSGKTYTLLGNDNHESEWGLVRRTFEAIFNCVDGDLTEHHLIQPGAANTFIMMAKIGVLGKISAEQSSESPMPTKLESRLCKIQSPGIWQMRSGKHIVSEKRRYACFISMLEVFGTMVYDLLDENTGQRSPALLISEDELGRAYASEAHRIEIRNAAQAMDILRKGLKRRESLGGKSHLIVNIHLAYVDYNRQLSSYELGGQDKIQWGQLTLVDMRSPRSGDFDAREYDNVTQIMLSLGSCLATLRTNQQAILKGKALKRSPSCRDARLSQLLKHYFDVAHAATVVCITSITQKVEDIHDNMRALKLADNIREIIRPRVAEFMVSTSTLPPGTTKDPQLPTSPPSVTTPSKAIVSFPTTKAASRPEKTLPFMSNAGRGRFITKKRMLDYNAIIGSPSLQVPCFDQRSALCDLLESIMRRRADLICHTESKWSELEMSSMLDLAPSNAIRVQLRDIIMAQKSATEILKECIHESEYCISEVKRIFELLRYQDFCKALVIPIDNRSQLVENLLIAHNEQMEHYASMTSNTKTSNNNHRQQAGGSAQARPKWRQRGISAGDSKGRTPDEVARAKLLEQRSIRTSATLMRMGLWRY